MATEVTKIIDPDNDTGTDYTSLDAWEDALGGTTTGNLPSDDQIAIAQCRNTSGSADTATITIFGWTTDATRYIKVEAYTGFQHAGTYDTSKYHITGSDTWKLYIQEDYVHVDGIQIGLTVTANNTGYCILMDTQGASNQHNFSKLILKGISATGTGGANGIYVNDANANVNVWNSIIHDLISASDAGDIHFVAIRWKKAATGNAWNCTIHNCSTGIEEGGVGTYNAINTAVFDCTDDFLNTISGDYCATDDDADRGTNGQDLNENASSEWTNAFTDYTTDDYTVKSGGLLEGNGVDNPGSGLYSDDILGNARSSTWDIGAFELVAAGAWPRNPLGHPLVGALGGPI